MKSHIAKLFLAFYVPYLAVALVVLALTFDTTLFDALLVFIVSLPASFSGNILPTIVGCSVAYIINFIVYRDNDDEDKYKSWMVLAAGVAIVELLGLIILYLGGHQAWTIALFYVIFFTIDAFISKKKMQKSANAGNAIASSVQVEETLMTRVDATWKKTGSSEMFKIYLKNRDRVCHLEQHMRGESMAEYHQLFAYSYYLVFGYDVDKQLSKYSSDAVVRALVAALKNLRIIDGYGYVVSNFMIESYKDIYKSTVKNLKL